jgi:hypothetical protein
LIKDDFNNVPSLEKWQFVRQRWTHARARFGQTNDHDPLKKASLKHVQFYAELSDSTSAAHEADRSTTPIKDELIMHHLPA